MSSAISSTVMRGSIFGLWVCCTASCSSAGPVTFLFRILIFSGGGRRSGSGGAWGGNWVTLAVMAIGVGLMVIGFGGTFFASMIKAAVSRQREFLADASAVQFTRQPDGIAGALKTIGGLSHGSRVESPNALQVSHLFFGLATSGLTSVFSTHPPLGRADPTA